MRALTCAAAANSQRTPSSSPCTRARIPRRPPGRTSGSAGPARRAVGVPSAIELDEADREELHELARVVLVGPDVARRVRLLIAEHREVHAHHRMQRHVLDQRAEIAEGVCARACRSSRRARTDSRRRADLRDHHDLRERERDALAQLVVAVQRVLEPDVEALHVEPGHVETRRYRIGIAAGTYASCSDGSATSCSSIQRAYSARSSPSAEVAPPRFGRAERRLVQEPVRLRVDARRGRLPGQAGSRTRHRQRPNRRILRAGLLWPPRLLPWRA